VCSGNRKSTGKHQGTCARKDNVHLKAILVTTTVCVAQAKETCHMDKYHRLRTRRGTLRTAVAIAGVTP
jgi:hypothetical protein